jgi:hypothetical protein
MIMRTKPGGFYRYMEQRWGINKAQAANYVAWVKHEIKVELVSQNPVLQLEDIKSNQLDSNVTPPPKTPRDKGTASSRAARSKHVPGKLNEEDAQALLASGNMVKVGDQYYAKGTPEFEAEMARRVASQNGDPEPKADFLETKKKAIKKIKSAQKTAGDTHSANFWLDDVGMEIILERVEAWLVHYMKRELSREDYLAGMHAGVRLIKPCSTAEIKSEDVALTAQNSDSTDKEDSGYIISSNADGTGVHARFEVALPGEDNMEMSLLVQAEAILQAFIELNLKNECISSFEEGLQAFVEASTNVQNYYENLQDTMQEAVENQQVPEDEAVV